MREHYSIDYFIEEKFMRERLIDYIEHARQGNIDGIPKFEYLRLKGLDLSGIDFSNVVFDHCIIEGCKFEGSNLHGTRFVSCKMKGRSTFDGCDLEMSSFCTAKNNAKPYRNLDFFLRQEKELRDRAQAYVDIPRQEKEDLTLAFRIARNLGLWQAKRTRDIENEKIFAPVNRLRTLPCEDLSDLSNDPLESEDYEDDADNDSTQFRMER